MFEQKLGKKGLQIKISPVAGESAAEIITDPHRGEVTHGRGLALAHAPGKEEECRGAIIAAVAELLRSDEWRSVLETFRRIKGSATKARQAAEEIRLLGLLPGRCRICSRLGT